MQSEINNKLKIFLSDHYPFSEECHVVYFIVQLRKLLEFTDENNHDFPLIKFYCDWVLHVDKRFKNPNWTFVIDKLDKGITDQGNGKYGVSIPKSLSFFYAFPLKFELRRLFKRVSLPVDVINTKEWWRSFQLLLFCILRDQPIVKPTKNVKEIRYTYVGSHMFNCTIEFNDRRGTIPFEIPI